MQLPPHKSVVQRNSIQLLPVISFFFHNADFHLGLEEAFTRNRFFPTVHRVPLAVLQAQDTKRRIFHQKPCRKRIFVTVPFAGI